MSDPSFFRNLKERKLVQWALAYLAGAFVVCQLVELTAEPWRISPGVQRTIHLLLIVGFFIVLVLAWYHGERGQQGASGPEVLMVAALLVIGGAVLWRLQNPGETTRPLLTGDSPPGGEDNRPALAVLPFDNLSLDPENEFFTDGIHDEILAQLSRIAGLRVISRTSVMEYKDKRPNLRTVAEALNVTSILEGTVRRSGGRVRITTQLIDALTDEHLWTEVYDRGLSDVFAVQSDVAEHVAEALRTTLTPAERVRIAETPTDNPEAYDSYLRGRRFWAQRSLAAFDSAITQFSRAVSLDPDYARAYAALAETYVLLPEYGGPSIPAVHHFVQAAIERALALDPALAEAYAASGYMKAVFEWDWAGAEEDYRTAIELNPDYSTAHQWYAELLGVNGRWEEALVQSRKALELDPVSAAAHNVMGLILAYSGQPEGGVLMLERARSLAPDWPGVSYDLAIYRVMAGDHAAAGLRYDHLAELTGGDARVYRSFLGALSDTKKAQTAERMLRAADVFSTTSKADYFARLGRFDEALALLEKDFAARNPRLPWVNVHPWYDGLRSDPRFRDLLRRMNLQD